jgi:hypothetical protein
MLFSPSANTVFKTDKYKYVNSVVCVV